jgi:hypothetical protein
MSKKWVTIDKSTIDLLEEVNQRDPGHSLGPLLKRFTKTQQQITTASAKAKGRNLQQWVCRKIADITGLPYEQSDDSCAIHSREMGQAGVDIVLRDQALERFPFSVECKASEGLNIKETVEQTKRNTYKGTDWLIVYNKKAIPETLVLMSWDTFDKLARRK